MQIAHNKKPPLQIQRKSNQPVAVICSYCHTCNARYVLRSLSDVECDLCRDSAQHHNATATLDRLAGEVRS